MLFLLHHLILYCSRNGTSFDDDHYDDRPRIATPLRRPANKRTRTRRSRQEPRCALGWTIWTQWHGMHSRGLGCMKNQSTILGSEDNKHSVLSLTRDRSIGGVPYVASTQTANQHFCELPPTHLGQCPCAASICVDEMRPAVFTGSDYR